MSHKKGKGQELFTVKSICSLPPSVCLTFSFSHLLYNVKQKHTGAEVEVPSITLRLHDSLRGLTGFGIQSYSWMVYYSKRIQSRTGKGQRFMGQSLEETRQFLRVFSLCLEHTKILDSRKENGCSAYAILFAQVRRCEPLLLDRVVESLLKFRFRDASQGPTFFKGQQSGLLW